MRDPTKDKAKHGKPDVGNGEDQRERAWRRSWGELKARRGAGASGT
jgi:hypothetical protein